MQELHAERGAPQRDAAIEELAAEAFMQVAQGEVGIVGEPDGQAIQPFVAAQDSVHLRISSFGGAYLGCGTLRRQCNRAGMLDGPRLPPASGQKPKSLVVFLHGYGADGNDLIGLGREWARHLPSTAFVSPNAREPCAGAPMGRQWFPLTMRDPGEFSRGAANARPALDVFLDQELARHRLDESACAL